MLTAIFVLWMLESFMHKHNHQVELQNKHVDMQNSHSDPQKTDNTKQMNNLTNQNLRRSPSTNKFELSSIENASIVPIKVIGKSFFQNLKDIQSTGWIAFVGDLLHKAADGFAVGASFAESMSLGFSTSLAILVHEIPHELGDYAVLLGAGFKFWYISLLNAITSFTCWVAFMIITSVSPSVLLREYIFAITTGVFLYIAIANMVSLINFGFELI